MGERVAQPDGSLPPSQHAPRCMHVLRLSLRVCVWGGGGSGVKGGVRQGGAACLRCRTRTGHEGREAARQAAGSAARLPRAQRYPRCLCSRRDGVYRIIRVSAFPQQVRPPPGLHTLRITARATSAASRPAHTAALLWHASHSAVLAVHTYGTHRYCPPAPAVPSPGGRPS